MINLQLTEHTTSDYAKVLLFSEKEKTVAIKNIHMMQSGISWNQESFASVSPMLQPPWHVYEQYFKKCLQRNYKKEEEETVNSYRKPLHSPGLYDLCWRAKDTTRKTYLYIQNLFNVLPFTCFFNHYYKVMLHTHTHHMWK